MKRRINLLLIFVLLTQSIFPVFAIQQENHIVSSLKQGNSWWDGVLPSWVATGGGISAGFLGAVAGNKALEVTNCCSDTILGAAEYIPFNILPKKGSLKESMLLNPTLWAGAGALGLGYGFYRWLYKRTPQGLYDSAKAFKDICKGLVVVENNFHDITSLNKAITNGDAKNKKLLTGSFYWVTIKEALDWIYDQGVIESENLERAENNSTDSEFLIQELKATINKYTHNAHTNRMFIQSLQEFTIQQNAYKQARNQELKEREVSAKEKMAGAHQSASRLAWIAWIERTFDKYNVFKKVHNYFWPKKETINYKDLIMLCGCAAGFVALINSFRK